MSIVLSLTVGKAKRIRRGQAHFWSVVRALTAEVPGYAVSAADILARSEPQVETGTVYGFLGLLERAGYVVPAERREGEAKRWRVVRRPAHLPRLSRDGRPVRSGQEAMWTAIRSLDQFTSDEVALAASTEEQPISQLTAASYVRALARAGYLKTVRPAVHGRFQGQKAILALRPKMNTGPLPPAILRTKLVYDQNRGEVVGPVTAEEAS